MTDQNIGKQIPKGKPILCLDFDGVLHSYTSGWQGFDIIPDKPVEGALDFVKEALNYFDVQVFSSRTKEESGYKAMIRWLEENGFPIDLMRFPMVKPPAFVTLDDRAIQFNGVFPSMSELSSFKSWIEKEKSSSNLSRFIFVLELEDTQYMSGETFLYTFFSTEEMANWLESYGVEDLKHHPDSCCFIGKKEGIGFSCYYRYVNTTPPKF